MTAARTLGHVTNPPCDRPTGTGPRALDRIGLRLLYSFPTGVRNHCVVTQRIGDTVYAATAGDAGAAYPARLGTRQHVDFQPHVHSGLVCFDGGTGRVCWRKDFSHPTRSFHISVFPQFIDRTGRGDWAVSCVTNPQGFGKGGEMRLYDLDGELIWSTLVPGECPWGNGSCVWDDLDADGRREIVFANCRDTTCVDAVAGTIRWSYTDGVTTCHGRPALGDVNGDGRNEIVFGSEYADDANQGLSSVFILDGRGRVLHRRPRIQGDFGSTPVVLHDVNGDGRPEIFIAGQNLCWLEPRHPTAIHTFDGELNEVWEPLPMGVSRFAVSSDGVGFGVQDYRDGGPLRGEAGVIAVRLRTGEILWRRGLDRLWLCGDPCLADLDGDGIAELIVSSNYPSGYAHQPGTEPWGDVYVFRQNGEHLCTLTLPDAAYAPIAVDVNGDGLAELLLPCHDGKVYVYTTAARMQRSDWPMPQGDPWRTGRA